MRIEEIIKEDVIKHSARVAVIAYRIALEVNGVNPELLLDAGAYHDLGKLFILNIIGKEGLLSQRDREMIKLHPIFSIQVLAGYNVDMEIARLILMHHSYPNGQGYPFKTEKLTDAELILQVADVADALNARRVYRKKPYRNWKSAMRKKGFPEDFITLVSNLYRDKKIPFDGERLDIPIEDILRKITRISNKMKKAGI